MSFWVSCAAALENLLPAATRMPAVNLEDPAVIEPLFELFHGTADDESLPEEVGGWESDWYVTFFASQPMMRADRG